MWAAGTTLTLPDPVALAGTAIVLLTAATLIGRYVVRPIVRGGRWVSDRLAEVRALVEQVRDLVQYVGMSAVEVGDRFSRLETHTGLPPWHSTIVAPSVREELTQTHTTTVVREEHTP
ncbi:MAG: hypothetical protein JWO67_9 [Streptosporangiaceae bacterium]|nr:hypothetical protein [Streptosporangiaceae bacterium]